MYVPSLELGLPHPFSRKRVCPPEVPIPTTGETLSTLPTLCMLWFSWQWKEWDERGGRRKDAEIITLRIKKITTVLTLFTTTLNMQKEIKTRQKGFSFYKFLHLFFTPHALLAKRLIGKVWVPLQNPLQNAKYFSHQRIRGLCRVSVLRNIWIK